MRPFGLLRQLLVLEPAGVRCCGRCRESVDAEAGDLKAALSEAGWRLHAGTNWLQFNPGAWRLGAGKKKSN